MRIHMTPCPNLLALCLSLAATAALAGNGAAAPSTPAAPATPVAPLAAAAPVTPAAPQAPADVPAAPSPADADETALQARMDAQARRAEERARRREAAADAQMDAAERRADQETRQREAALRGQMDAARHRLEVAAQQLAALSAQMYGPMAKRFAAFAGPPHVLVGLQLDASGDAGARVREVSPGGPAQQAGVRSGDLIVAVNGTDVRGRESAGRVVELLHDVKPGDKVDLKVLRDGKAHELTVTARPGGNDLFFGLNLPDFPPLPRVRAVGQWRDAPMIIRGPMADMELAALTPGLGRYFGTDSGVLVVRAPAERGLGLQDGDVILSIGGRKPTDSSHVIRILASYDPGEKITLEVMRMHRRISVATTLPAEPPLPQGPFMIRKEGALGAGPVRIKGEDGTAF